jgi:hypothetical protein
MCCLPVYEQLIPEHRRTLNHEYGTIRLRTEKKMEPSDMENESKLLCIDVVQMR